MTSKPPLRGRLPIFSAAEIGVTWRMGTEIVFARHRAGCWIKLTTSVRTVNMEEATSALPETRCEVDPNVSTDINVFHFSALPASKVINNVEVLEVSTKVISVIDVVSWVTACCSPVSGVSLQGSDSWQTQAIHIPIVGVLVHWTICLEAGRNESGKPVVGVAPRHHQGPSRSGL